jgi:hypothetical protein
MAWMLGSRDTPESVVRRYHTETLARLRAVETALQRSCYRTAEPKRHAHTHTHVPPGAPRKKRRARGGTQQGHGRVLDRQVPSGRREGCRTQANHRRAANTPNCALFRIPRAPCHLWYCVYHQNLRCDPRSCAGRRGASVGTRIVVLRKRHAKRPRCRQSGGSSASGLAT